jgi:hypothetical protein
MEIEAGWKKYNVDPYNPFYDILLQVIKQVQPNQDKIQIRAVNRARSEKLKQEMAEQFRFYFDWQDDDPNICGVEVYRMVEGE